MPPRKGAQKRKVESKTERGKKKAKMEMSRSSSDNNSFVPPPPGFAMLPLKKSSADNNTVQDVPLPPQPKKNNLDLAYMNKSASSNDSTVKVSGAPGPVNLASCPGETNKNQAHSFNLTEMALIGDCHVDQDEVESPAVVTVAGCELKEEFVSMARIIERKHGDILAECSFVGKARSRFFEDACAIYQRLERTKLTDITLRDLELMKNDVRDLLTAKVNVGWLDQRLDEIHYARQSLQSARFMKEQRDKTRKRIVELEKEVQLHEKMAQDAKRKLELEKVEAERLGREHTPAKRAVMRFYEKSLVEGI